MKEQTPAAQMPQTIPIDPELQSILLQVVDCRTRLHNFQKSIRDRALYEFMSEIFRKTDDCLTDCVGNLSVFMSDWVSYKLLDDK
jgi:hypothetical protein